MGCGLCGTGKPAGCGSKGNCGGGCNRLNVFGWLKDIPMPNSEAQCKVIEVSFNNGSRKDFYRNVYNTQFKQGDYITVEATNGFDVGKVSLVGELVRFQLNKKNIPEHSNDIKRVLRPSNPRDLENYHQNKGREPQVQAKVRELAINLSLKMKLSDVEIQADGKKATFYYTADDRVDFRELIKQYAAEFKLKVEMRQIGIRQEAAKVGGIGSCGRELCCSTWLTDFVSINTTAARYQNLSINQTKLSGQCGRLKCCLNFELDTYLDALQFFPNNADTLQTTKGSAFLIKKDIFKNLMWYVQQGGAQHFPLTIERVKEIKNLNLKGILPEDLGSIEIPKGKNTVEEPSFVDVVGQISLRSLNKSSKKRKQKQQEKPPAKPHTLNKSIELLKPLPAKSLENKANNPASAGVILSSSNKKLAIAPKTNINL